MEQEQDVLDLINDVKNIREPEEAKRYLSYAVVSFLEKRITKDGFLSITNDLNRSLKLERDKEIRIVNLKDLNDAIIMIEDYQTIF